MTKIYTLETCPRWEGPVLCAAAADVETIRAHRYWMEFAESECYFPCSDEHRHRAMFVRILCWDSQTGEEVASESFQQWFAPRAELKKELETIHELELKLKQLKEMYQADVE